ncbi:DoxX family protein [Shimia ponticola]|uniref:DoxX family protein n=1 Tax=Shimia ponticola TaxID=2582893 RepID=UPI002104302F|nr:DoxX family membrane protein [Shimia ponticola]
MLTPPSGQSQSRTDPSLIDRLELTAGRVLFALLFFAGAIQKGLNPDPAQALLSGFGLPIGLIWPALIFNAVAAVFLIVNLHIRPTARALAAYCLITSAFHYVPDDPWQMSIMIKNWAIAGGCFALSQAAGRSNR